MQTFGTRIRRLANFPCQTCPIRPVGRKVVKFALPLRNRFVSLPTNRHHPLDRVGPYMDSLSRLSFLFENMSCKQLRKHLAALQRVAQGDHCYSVGDGLELRVSSQAASRLAHGILGELKTLRTNRVRICRQLRNLARYLPVGQVLTGPYGKANIFDWCGNRKLCRVAVFSYSGPRPTDPWFLELDPESQSTALLLVAAALETEPQ